MKGKRVIPNLVTGSDSSRLPHWQINWGEKARFSAVLALREAREDVVESEGFSQKKQKKSTQES